MSQGVPSLKAALAEARRLGCTVTTVRRTGEVLVVSPTGERCRVNHRRDDASRALIAMLRRVRAGTSRPSPTAAFLTPTPGRRR